MAIGLQKKKFPFGNRGTGIEIAIWAAVAATTAATAITMSQKKPSFPKATPPPKPTMPTAPSAADETAISEEEKRKERAKAGILARRRRAGQTIATSPGGVLGEAKVEKKFLLGE